MKFNHQAFAKAIIDYKFKISYAQRKNIGLRELGKQMKVSSSTLSRLINGHEGKIDSILAICNVISKPITNFISNEKRITY